MSRPTDDPAAFVAAAESTTNRPAVEEVMAVYAPGAVLEAVTDGALEVRRGHDELRAAWNVYMDVMRGGSFRLSKRLLAADDDSITNSWEGTMAGAPARGLEAWHFDEDGLVDRHLLYSYLRVGPSDGFGPRLRLLISYPSMAIRFLRASRRPETIHEEEAHAAG